MPANTAMTILAVISSHSVSFPNTLLEYRFLSNNNYKMYLEINSPGAVRPAEMVARAASPA